MEKLLYDIANCENIHKVLNDDFDSHCSKIIKSQNNDFANFQLPEPWNGDIENAKILFISSNPSISQTEKYPLGSWADEDIKNFFINRFSKDAEWVKEQRNILRKDGTYSKKPVKFWSEIGKTASILLNINDPEPGKDYAITEIVHCKSVKEIGVKKAVDTCTSKYLKRILNISSAKVIVCLGAHVLNVLSKLFNLKIESRISSMPDFNKMILFLPHPNAWQVRRLDKLFTDEELIMIKNEIKK